MSSRPERRGIALTPDERLEIQKLALVDGCSQSEIARRVGRDRGTVAAVMRAVDSKAMSEQLQTDARERVLHMLLGSTAQAVREWAAAMVTGAAKGDHRPSKDWLLHAGVIDPLQSDGPNTRIMIQIGTDGHPMQIPSPLRRLADEREDDGDGTT